MFTFWYDDNANFIGVDFQPCTMLCLTEDIYNAHALLPADAKKFVKAKSSPWARRLFLNTNL